MEVVGRVVRLGGRLLVERGGCGEKGVLVVVMVEEENRGEDG